MSDEAKRPPIRSKRPYERPLLEPSAIFGAEALTGTCCRGGTCSNAVRNTQRTTTDVNKQKSNVSS
jgi:hypothetical protein